MSSAPVAEWVAVAALIRPQGRRGELLAEPLTSLPEIFATGRGVVLAKASAPDAGSLRATIEEHWFPTGKNSGRVVLKLSDCDSISHAEALAGLQVLVSTDALPKLDSDTFYVGDLVGCDLYDGDRRMGRVDGVEFAMAPDGHTRLEDAAPLLAVVAGENTEPVLVPFVRTWLDCVDLEDRRVIMHLPPGLFDNVAE